MRFNSAPAALLWSCEILSCGAQGVNFDDSRIAGTLIGVSNSYHDALYIKILADRIARKNGTQDHRGNWLYLSVVPMDSPINWQEWESRKTDAAMKDLEHRLESKGYIVK